MRVFMSDGVKGLNLPPEAIKATVESVTKPRGKEGKFSINPLR
jgi:hypothetical protein